MQILITNDDGITAQGIVQLAEAAKAFGTVTVAAPADQCSAMSQKITLRSITVERCDFPVEGVEAYRVHGTPADCIKAAVEFLPEKPDVVLSGINFGYNVGWDIAYSGTVGAAMEALMNGIPAIALSRHHAGSWEDAMQHLPAILAELLAQPLEKEIWNVNFPAGVCRGILRDRKLAGLGYYTGDAEVLRDGGTITITYPPMPNLENAAPRGSEDSDLNAVMRGYISIGKLKCQVM